MSEEINKKQNLSTKRAIVKKTSKNNISKVNSYPIDPIAKSKVLLSKINSKKPNNVKSAKKKCANSKSMSSVSKLDRMHEDFSCENLSHPNTTNKHSRPSLAGCKGERQCSWNLRSKIDTYVENGNKKLFVLDKGNTVICDIANGCPAEQSESNGTHSNSIINDKTAEVLENDEVGYISCDSMDSSNTIPYEYTSPSLSCQNNSFSPLPSTSKDTETISKNDIKFNESLLNNDSIEVIDNEKIQNDKTKPNETPIEILDDSVIIIDLDQTFPEANTHETTNGKVMTWNNNVKEKTITKVHSDTSDNGQCSNVIAKTITQIYQNQSAIGNNVANGVNISSVSLLSSSNNSSMSRDISNPVIYIESPIYNTNSMMSSSRSLRAPIIEDVTIIDSRTNNDECYFVKEFTADMNVGRGGLKSRESDHDIIIVTDSPRVNKTSLPVRTSNTMQEPAKKLVGDCPICMDNLSHNEIASTICGHLFCMNCIKAAIKANGRKCPTCRKVLKGNCYHKIFL